MLLHEVLEKAAVSFLVFRDVLFQCRYRHRARVGDCEGNGNLSAQGEPFDVAVKFSREKESGLQCRVHEIMLFDRNENALETHDDLQSVGTSPAVRAQPSGHRTNEAAIAIKSLTIPSRAFQFGDRAAREAAEFGRSRVQFLSVIGAARLECGEPAAEAGELIRRELGNSFGDFFDLHGAQYSTARLG